MKPLLIALFTAFSFIIHAQNQLLPPIPDNTLVAFLEDLEEAVESKDKAFIIDHLAENVMFSFGAEGRGPKDFANYWNLNEPNNESFWVLLNRIVKMGGGNYNGDGMYSLPYVFSDWPDEIEPYEYLAITGSNVNIRDRPTVNGSKVVGQFNYDIVLPDYEKCISTPEGKIMSTSFMWFYVKSMDEQLEGYVYGDFVWSPLGYRLGLKKSEKDWQITFLIAGD